MNSYVGPYFEFEVLSENLRDTPYSSPEISAKLLAVVRLRPKIYSSGSGLVHKSVIAFIPRRWVVGISSISEDNVFHIGQGSVVDAQNSLYSEYSDECDELETFFNTEMTMRFGFVCLG